MYTHEEKLDSLLTELDGREEGKCNYFHSRALMIPSRKEIITVIKDIQQLMFPDYFCREENQGKTRREILDGVFIKIKRQITASYSFCNRAA